MGDACEVEEADATSTGVGDAPGLGDTTGVAAEFADAAGVILGLGETTGVGPVLLSAADEFWELGEPAGSAATPGRVDAHHIRTKNNTCRRITLSRLVIVG